MPSVAEVASRVPQVPIEYAEAYAAAANTVPKEAVSHGIDVARRNGATHIGVESTDLDDGIVLLIASRDGEEPIEIAAHRLGAMLLGRGDDPAHNPEIKLPFGFANQRTLADDEGLLFNL